MCLSADWVGILILFNSSSLGSCCFWSNFSTGRPPFSGISFPPCPVLGCVLGSVSLGLSSATLSPNPASHVRKNRFTAGKTLERNLAAGKKRPAAEKAASTAGKTSAKNAASQRENRSWCVWSPLERLAFVWQTGFHVAGTVQRVSWRSCTWAQSLLQKLLHAV